MENDIDTKYIFTDNGEVQIYRDEILDEVSSYSITSSCGDTEINSSKIFLSITNSSQSNFCSFLETLDYESQGKMILLTASQGKVIVFLKQ